MTVFEHRAALRTPSSNVTVIVAEADVAVKANPAVGQATAGQEEESYGRG
jgi:hypothetical protein